MLSERDRESLTGPIFYNTNDRRDGAAIAPQVPLVPKKWGEKLARPTPIVWLRERTPTGVAPRSTQKIRNRW